jgi:lysophospholipid acyltransferase (LPLAT)-like uncharacterized protein
MSDGAIGIALKSKLPIFVMNYTASHYWQLGSWDKFVIPKPFGLIRYYISEMIDVSDMDLLDAKLVIKKGLLKHEN